MFLNKRQIYLLRGPSEGGQALQRSQKVTDLVQNNQSDIFSLMKAAPKIEAQQRTDILETPKIKQPTSSNPLVPLSTKGNLVGQEVKTDQGPYTLQGASEGGQPFRNVDVPQKRYQPRPNPINVNLGSSIVKPLDQTTIQQQNNQVIPQQNISPINQEVIPSSIETQPNPEDILNLSPEQQAQKQYEGLQQTAKKQSQVQNQFYNQQDQVLAQQQQQAQDKLMSTKTALEKQNEEALNKFKESESQNTQFQTSQVQDQARNALDQASTALAFEGFGRSTKAADIKANIGKQTAYEIFQINQNSEKRVNEYQAGLLDNTNKQLQVLQEKVNKIGDARSQLQLENMKAQKEIVTNLIKQNPFNPQNMFENSLKLANFRLEQRKLDNEERKQLRGDAQEALDMAIKYGFTPEALSEEQKANIASNLGIPTSKLNEVISRAVEKQNKADMQVSYQTDIDGNVTAIVFDKNTGQFKTSGLGTLGRGQVTRYQAVTDPITGSSRVFDPITGRFLDGGSYGGGGYSKGSNIPVAPGQPGSIVITATTDNTPAKIRDNCVFYARYVMGGNSALPLGLTTSQDKLNYLKRKDNTLLQPDGSTIPMVGSMVVMSKFGDPSIGHVAVLKSINGDGTYTIKEANVKRDGKGSHLISERTGTLQQLGINGFYSNQNNKLLASGYKPSGATGPEIPNQNYPNDIPGETQIERDTIKAIVNGIPMSQTDFRNSYIRIYDPNNTNRAQISAEADAKWLALAGKAGQEKSAAEQVKKENEYSDTKALAAGYAKRMSDAENIVQNLSNQGFNFSDPKYLIEKGVPSNIFGFSVGNFAKSPEYQQFEQAVRDFGSAVLRKESGAAISQSEYDQVISQYFPQPGDSPQVIEQKRKNRLQAIKNIQFSSGGLFNQLNQGQSSGGGTYSNIFQQSQNGVTYDDF